MSALDIFALIVLLVLVGTMLLATALGKLAGEFSEREALGIDFTFRWLR